MTHASEFYMATLANQRKILEEKIQEGKRGGNPVIELPFDTYPILEDEMEELGWVYDSWENEETGEKHAIFFPKEYVDDEYDEDDE